MQAAQPAVVIITGALIGLSMLLLYIDGRRRDDR